MASESEGLQQHPGSGGSKEHEMFKGESPPSPTVAVPERVKKELEEKRREREAGTDQSEELSEPNQPEVDDKAVSEVVRKPTKTAGDLSQAAGGSAVITLEELLLRVRRIEEYLGIGAPQEAEAFDYPSEQPPRRPGKQHPIVRTPGSEAYNLPPVPLSSQERPSEGES
jgi:hypothetical protein